jgi:sugar transferase (PEP-CTERM/EpsH1 system associated)
MEPLLFLAHRIPYPPNKGDKIRSYHLLKALTKRFDVYLGSFVDDPTDWRYQRDLAGLCAEVRLRPLPPFRAKMRSLIGIWSNEPLTIPYYRDGKLAAWVERIVDERKIRKVVVFSSSMAQYVAGPRVSKALRIVDFVDVDSDKWRQYALDSRWPASWLYRREAERLLTYERRIAEQFDYSFFVSPEEAELFRARSPGHERSIDFYQNGVDTAFFDPELDFPTPFGPHTRALVFTGAMDYRPNTDAVVWFAREVLPRITESQPEARFYIVGSNPSSDVKRLARDPAVEVTGRVSDVRPYLKHCEVVVAPLKLARGIQNKVLEGLAMGKCVIATSAAAEGLNVRARESCDIGDGAVQFASRCLDRLKRPPGGTANPQGRKCIEEYYSWESNLRPLLSCLSTDKEVRARAVGSAG